MKCMCAQTRPRFILSSEGVFGGMEFELMLTPREKSPLPKMSPEEDRTCDAVDSKPKHYQLSYSGPPFSLSFVFSFVHHTYFHLWMVFIDKLLVWPHPDLDGSLVVVDFCVIASLREGVGLWAGNVTQFGTTKVNQASATHPHLI